MKEKIEKVQKQYKELGFDWNRLDCEDVEKIPDDLEQIDIPLLEEFELEKIMESFYKEIECFEQLEKIAEQFDMDNNLKLGE